MKIAFMEGYIAGDVQEKATSNGFMLTFGFNSPSSKRKQDGTWESEAEFFDCKYFYKDVNDDAAKAILAKDGRFSMRFTPHQERWEKDGQKRSKIVFTVESVYMQPKAAPTPATDYEMPF